MKVAAIQLASGTNVSANLIEAGKQLEAAAREGARLLVLPENFAFLDDGSGTRSIAETEGDGPLQDFLAKTAARLGAWIVGGTLPMAGTDPDRWRAASLVYDDEGKCVARYDKWHLFDVNVPGSDETYTESAHIEPGDRLVVVDTPAGRLGLAICYDLRFPELFRAMLEQDVEIFALPAAFTAITGSAHWEPLVRARAIENLAYVVAAAQGGFHVNGRETFGHSMVVDPWGRTLAMFERGNGHAVADIDREFQQATRQNFPALKHRRIFCN